jgi:hypothetical protein
VGSQERRGVRQGGPGRPHAVCRQQSRQGAGAIRRSGEASAPDPADDPAADAGAAAVAAGSYQVKVACFSPPLVENTIGCVLSGRKGERRNAAMQISVARAGKGIGRRSEAVDLKVLERS